MTSRTSTSRTPPSPTSSASSCCSRTRDRELLSDVRAFMTREVEPVINDYWTRAEFPHDLVPGIAALGIAGLAFDGPGCPDRGALVDGMVAMELGRVDPSIATFMGVHGGLAMGSIDLCGSEEQRERWLPAMARMELIGAFGLTEPEHGSDISQGLADHRPPRRRRVGAQRREEVDRQRRVRRPGDDLGARRGRRAGQGVRRREGHRGDDLRQAGGQDRAARRAERRDPPHRRTRPRGQPAAAGRQLPLHRRRAPGDPDERRLAGDGLCPRSIRARAALHQGSASSSAARSRRSRWCRTCWSRCSPTSRRRPR